MAGFGVAVTRRLIQALVGNGCRQLTFILVMSPAVQILVDEREVDMSAIRAQGAGGQNYNKVSSAIHRVLDIHVQPARRRDRASACWTWLTQPPDADEKKGASTQQHRT
jgi:hypothetical protein